ncbi:MAG TPA: exonuclease SbcCD subunit D [Clostridiaceae bacterium]|jgi:exonuclease SbcD|nr:exonuclease SbcCD subunit D [Clostridia bacterium]HJJ12906.1 exonuclease SbcCD subunit D [Clostridiaceae bacterium]
MKILHLADLHFGKILQEQSLIEDQEYILKEIINIIKEKEIKALLISGDIYDRSVPPTEAVNLLDNFLKILIKDLKIKVFIISGNHDSKDRLGFGNKIFEDEGLYIESKYNGRLKKVRLEDEYGPLNIYMLPFIKPVEVKKFFEDDLENNYDLAINKIIEKEEIDKSERNIIMVHQFVTAGNVKPERTESEVLSLGGIENVDVSNFKSFDYVAIGHVHRPQKIGRDTARYAGTILKYSFSEINHNKSIPIIDIKEKGNITINLLPLKPLRDMREIKGPIEELIKEENYKEGNLEDYIKAIITNEEPVYDAIGKIKKIYPNTLKLEIQNSKTINSNTEQNINLEEVKKKSELELFSDFYKLQNNLDLNEKQKEIVKNIISEVKHETN